MDAMNAVSPIVEQMEEKSEKHAASQDEKVQDNTDEPLDIEESQAEDKAQPATEKNDVPLQAHSS